MAVEWIVTSTRRASPATGEVTQVIDDPSSLLVPVAGHVAARAGAPPTVRPTSVLTAIIEGSRIRRLHIRVLMGETLGIRPFTHNFCGYAPSKARSRMRDPAASGVGRSDQRVMERACARPGVPPGHPATRAAGKPAQTGSARTIRLSR
ncbi:putative Aconitate hydratase B [Frankia alni ACN14a]|uniref:Aconitate hydratase B n=1 Tax=Frankia alni (strain DSM 45986 / CECT 9034 / ACN14a) TaxID=326424 RepID=Q0RKM7_FRAAA|nr:putative Aconitate hydratase B [Frankia alni ACN14a]